MLKTNQPSLMSAAEQGNKLAEHIRSTGFEQTSLGEDNEGQCRWNADAALYDYLCGRPLRVPECFDSITCQGGAETFKVVWRLPVSGNAPSASSAEVLVPWSI
jgi:hypothetical protein